MHTAGEAIVLAAALGPKCAARPALVARPLAPSSGVRSAICQINQSSKATFEFYDATATKFLMYPFYSGYTNWPELEKGMDTKLAAGVPRLQ
jgi:hypothetical protein